MSPLMVLRLMWPRRLACTVRAPETVLPLKSPARAWHSISPLTVLALTSPTMSSSVSEPETVFALTVARTPLINASALTVLALMCVVAGTEMLTLALRLPLSVPMSFTLSQRLPSLSLTWVILRVEPSQLTRSGFPLDLVNLDSRRRGVVVGDDVHPPGDQADLELADGLVLVADVENLRPVDLPFLCHVVFLVSRALASTRHSRYIAYQQLTI